MSEKLYALEANGPMVAREAIAMHSAGKYSVFTIAYDRAKSRAFHHRTLKAALRTLSSVADSARGKLHSRGEFAAGIVTPSGRVLTWIEARAIVRGEPQPAHLQHGLQRLQA